jgi:hypothetical protein
MGIPEGVSLTLLNRTAARIDTPGVAVVAGDARDMSEFPDASFDVVFSNSVVEHVGSFADQAAIAGEVQRVGRRFFLQTPNRFLPVEPHFLVPGFQFLPIRSRAWLHGCCDLGWMKRAGSYEAALQEVGDLRLLTPTELKSLFPSAQIWLERFFGLPESYVAYGSSRRDRGA